MMNFLVYNLKAEAGNGKQCAFMSLMAVLTAEHAQPTDRLVHNNI